jgi:hypothetical protein
VVISVEFLSCGQTSSIVQSGFSFTVTFTPFTGCGLGGIATRNFPVGKLPLGNYIVSAVNTVVGDTTLVAFAVTPAAIPAVPAVEPFGLVLVAAAILFIVIPRLLRR